ncbi:MAG: hypothetical protein AAF078_10445 [Planctomycetota bacterium]
MSTTTASTNATPAAARPEPIWPRLVGLGLVALILYWAIYAGGWPGVYVDLPSALFVVVGVLGTGLLVSGGALIGAVRGLITGDRAVDRATVIKRSQAWQRMRGIAWAIGVLGTLVGLISVLWDLRPEHFGAGLAISALPLFYGGILAELVLAPLAVVYAARAGHAESDG